MGNALPYLALTMGLMSSFHCIGMCGPIALALPIQRGNKFQQFTALVFYNGGRILTYSVLGFLLGSVGTSIAWIGYLRYLSIMSGLLILFYVFWPAKLDPYFHPPQFWQKFVRQIKNNMAQMLRSHKLGSWLMLGILNGLLPCGLVYLALITSVATGNPASGSTFMLMFGAGTFPAMMAVGFFKQLFTVSLRTRMRKLTPFLLAIAGFWLVFRGFIIQYPANSPSGAITVCHGK